MAVSPEYVSVDEEAMNDIYNGINSKDFYVKFTDKDGNIVDDIKCINMTYN